MTNKEFFDILRDIYKIIEESESKDEAIKKIKDKYVKK